MTPLQVWLRRGAWLIIGIAAFWAAYKFGSKYSQCRAGGGEKVYCFADSVSSLWADTIVLVITSLTKILRLVLP